MQKNHAGVTDAMVPLTTPVVDARLEIERLDEAIAESAAHIHAATYRLLCLIREFDERGGWAEQGFRSCAHYLNYRIGLSLGAGREKVRTAHALAELPLVSDAYRQGQLSFSKVRAITRVATPTNEEMLLDMAKAGTASHLEKIVREFRKATGVKEVEQANLQYERRRLRTYFDADGMLVIEGRFAPEDGAQVMKALSSAHDELWQAQTEAESEGQDTLEGEVFEAEPEQKWADAVVLMSKRSLEAPEARGQGADRTQVVVHIDAEVLSDTTEQGRSSLEDGPCVSAETSRRLACDAGIVPIYEDQDGTPLDVGRRTRSISPALRRALYSRDQGCRFPGCDQTRHLHGHHLEHWADGGETSLENVCFLCGFHHRLVHEGGFGVKGMADGTLRFTAPDHTPLPKVRSYHLRGYEGDALLREENERLGLTVSERTCLTEWDGVPVDYDLAVFALVQRQERAKQEQARRLEEQAVTWDPVH